MGKQGTEQSCSGGFSIYRAYLMSRMTQRVVGPFWLPCQKDMLTAVAAPFYLSLIRRSKDPFLMEV